MNKDENTIRGIQRVFVGPVKAASGKLSVSDIENMTEITGALKPIVSGGRIDQQSKLVEILGEHRHVYDTDCEESFGCSCGWTQAPDSAVMEMVTRSTVYPDRRWPETLAEDLFSRHLASEITKGLNA